MGIQQGKKFYDFLKNLKQIFFFLRTEKFF